MFHRSALTPWVSFQVNPGKDAAVQRSIRTKVPPDRSRSWSGAQRLSTPGPASFLRGAGSFPVLPSPSSSPDTGAAPPGHGAAEAGSPPGVRRGEERESSRTHRSFWFLEQKYGHFYCSHCDLEWGSAHVWCIVGTNKVYFKQDCRRCNKAFNPYHVVDLKCSSRKK